MRDPDKLLIVTVFTFGSIQVLAVMLNYIPVKFMLLDIIPIPFIIYLRRILFNKKERLSDECISRIFRLLLIFYFTILFLSIYLLKTINI
jgi:hypothetical protein